MDIKIIDKKITEAELHQIAREFYVSMIKGVVDTRLEILAMGGEYHMDANNILIQNGSKQEDVWGFNWYFDRVGDERIEYVSLINIRPTQGNMTMELEDSSLRGKIKKAAYSRHHSIKARGVLARRHRGFYVGSGVVHRRCFL